MGSERLNNSDNKKIDSLVLIFGDKGYITYDDIEQKFKHEINNINRFDMIISALEGRDVKFVSHADDEERKVPAHKTPRKVHLLSLERHQLVAC